jgi:hypothetical protein
MGGAPGTYVVPVFGEVSDARLLGNVSVDPASPSISVSPSTAAGGTSVTISGTGFLPGTVFINGPAGGQATADEVGSFSLTRQVLFGLVPTKYTVDARGKDSHYLVTAQFGLTGTVPVSGPKLIVSRGSVQAGGSVGVEAVGLPPGGAIEFRMRSASTAALADASGTTRATLTIPPFEPAVNYFVTATASTAGATAPLTITRPTAHISLSRATAAPGAVLSVTGDGFLPGERVGISGHWGAPIFVNADASGALNAEAKVGPAPAGYHAIVAFANDSGNQAFALLAIGPP